MNIEKTNNERPETILLVDDSPINLGVVVEGLESCGYEVLVALDGEEALKRLDVVLPDLILLDVLMPGMDGYEVCRRLKEREETRAIPVIFMTSLDSTEDKVAGFAAGAVDYITKPLQFDEVRSRVGVHLKLRALQRELESNNHRLSREIAERERVKKDLAQREREYRSLAENMPDNIARWDTEGRYLYVNPTHERTLGMSLADLIGTYIPDGHQAVKAAIAQVVATGQPVPFVCQPALGGNGEMMLHDVSLAPEWDEAGNLVSVLGLGRDMTHIYRMQEQIAASEQALREQAAFQKSLLDAMSEVGLQVMVVENGKIIHVGNREVAHQFGYSDAELDAHPGLLDIIHPDDRARVADSYQRRLEGETVPSSYELGLVTRDGERREYETAIAVVPGSKPMRIVTVGKDISERKALENALKESEAQYRTSSNLLHSIFESSPDVITFALDKRYRYLAFNSKHKAVMQAIWGKEIALGMNMLDVIGEHTDRESARRGFDRALSGESFVLEEAYGAEHLSRQHWQNYWSPIRSDTGEVIGLTVFVMNVTERKAMELALAQREREFRTLAENSPDPIFRYDGDCRRLYANAVVGKLAGKPVEELIGSLPTDGALLVSEQSKKLMDAIRRVLDSGENEQIELFINQAGARRDYHVLLAPERNAGGQVATVLVMARDITAIRDAERRMTSFLANFPGFAYSFRLSPDGHACFPFASPGIEQLYGLKPDDVKDDMAPIHALAHPDDQPRIEATIAESARTMAPFHVETRVCRPGLPERWIEVRSAPLREADGSIIWHGLMIDIDARKRLENALRENRELLNEAQRIAQVGSWELDLVGNVLSWSDEIFRLFEINPQKFGASYAAFLDTIHPDDREAVNRAYIESLESRAPYAIEHRLLMPDGRIKYVHEHCETQYAADGKPLRSIGTVQDITERKRLEERLVKHEREFRTLAENSPDIVVRYDRDCRFVYANPRFQKRFGYTMEQLSGKRPTELPGLLEASFIEPKILEVLHTGIADEFEHHIHTVDGRDFWGLVHVVPELDESGRVAYAQILTRDISALKEAERTLEESRNRLREVAAQRDTDQEEDRKRLAWDVHEGIGQNLMALHVGLSVLDKKLDGQLPAVQERIRAMMGVVDSSIEQVRNVTRSLRPRVLDMGIVTSLEWLVEQFTSENGIPCQFNAPDEPALDDHASTILFRVAEEALSNVARHAEAGEVFVLLELRGMLCRLEIRDDGRGFDLDDKYESRSTGLVWVHERIASLGGECVVLSRPGGGTVIEVMIPLLEKEGENR